MLKSLCYLTKQKLGHHFNFPREAVRIIVCFFLNKR